MIRVASHDVAMRVDESRHERHALGVDFHQPGRRGGPRGNRCDTSVPDHDGALLDRPTVAINDACVGDQKILGDQFLTVAEVQKCSEKP